MSALRVQRPAGTHLLGMWQTTYSLTFLPKPKTQLNPEFNLGRRKTLIYADKRKISAFCVFLRPIFVLKRSHPRKIIPG
jgi:hypothetical protein